ncbi:MAG: hypothetical protein QW203_07765, partial [Thermoplasmatales archaeon]
TLSNTTSTATSPNLQVRLNINFSAIRGLSVDLGNIRFSSDQAGNNLLYAWLESAPQGTFTQGTNVSAYTSSNVWVNLGNNIIPANGLLNIYMQILSSGTEFDGVYWGANPLWTSTYGQYDNGAKVFSLYVNGNSPISDFTVTSGFTLAQATGVSYGSATINALKLTGYASTGGISFYLNTASLPASQSYIAEGNGQWYTNATSGDTDIVSLIQNPSSSPNAIAVGGIPGNINVYFDQEYMASGSYRPGINDQGTAGQSWVFGSLTYIAGSTTYSAYTAPQLYSTSGGYSGSATNPISSTGGNIYLGVLGQQISGYPANAYWNWLRVRVYPPNGTDPVLTSIQILLLSNYTSASVPSPEWTTLSGKPYVTVSSKGILNGLSNMLNDGADFGPDTLLGASSPSQYGPPYTQTSGIQEAFDYAIPLGFKVMLVGDFNAGFYIDVPLVLRSTYINAVIEGTGGDGETYIRCSSNFSGNYLLSIELQGNLRLRGIRWIPQLPNGTKINYGFNYNYTTNSDLFYSDFTFDAPAIAHLYQAYYVSGRQFFERVQFNGGGQYFFYTTYSNAMFQFNQCHISSPFYSMPTSPGSQLMFDQCVGPYMHSLNSSPNMQNTNIWIANSDMVFQGTAQIGNNVNIWATNGRYSQYAAANSINIQGTNVFILLRGGYGNYVGGGSGNFYFITSASGSTGLAILEKIQFRNYSSGTSYYLTNSSQIQVISRNNYSGDSPYPISLVGNNITTLPANPPASGTVYQNTNPYDIRIYLPAYATTSGTSGSVAIALGISSTPSTIGTKFINGSTSSSATEIIELVVPAGWYYEFTSTGVTFGTATVLPA